VTPGARTPSSSTLSPGRLRAALGRLLGRALSRAGGPRATAALALVTHHFAPDRLVHLAGALAAFEAWPSARRAAVVVTNTADPGAMRAIHAAAPARPRRGFSIEVVTAPPLEHPLHLPWAQKALLRERFLDAGTGFTHLLSIEDDMAVPPEAFVYWLAHRAPLARHGLIPSFLRVEPRPGDGLPMATDALAPNGLAGRTRVRAGEHDFVALDNPYCALFVLDRALAAEYAASPSFDRCASRALTPWPVRERAAMGLCWESPPQGFPTRFVVPVDAAGLGVARCAWVEHLAANYAADPTSVFARITAAEVFRPLDSSAR